MYNSFYHPSYYDKSWWGLQNAGKFWILFFFFWARSSLLCTGFLQSWWIGATLLWWMDLLWWLLLLQSTGSRLAGSEVLVHGLSICGAQASLPRSMRNLPGPEIEPVSPALAGGFLSTAPLGKSWIASFICLCFGYAMQLVAVEAPSHNHWTTREFPWIASQSWYKGNEYYDYINQRT